MNAELKAFARAYFPDSKSDLFAISVERIMQLVPDNRFIGFMTPFTWMFLSSYEKMRANLLNQKTLTSLIRPEYHAFFDSAYVPICTFTLFSSNLSKFKGTFIDLTKFYGADMQAPKALEAIQNQSCGWRHKASSEDFNKIPGSPIAYWVSSEIRNAFTNEMRLSDYAVPKQGFATGDNDRFLRKWSEVSYSNIEFDCSNNEDSVSTKKKWFPCNKGGAFRKWFGNNSIVANWENNGEEMKNFKGSVIRNPSYYFKEGMTWSTVSSFKLSMRYSPMGFLFETKGSVCFPIDENPVEYSLGLMNSKVAETILLSLSPTLDFHEGPIGNVPIKIVNKNKILTNVKTIIDIAKKDWDSTETSWNFLLFPLSALSKSEKLIELNYKYIIKIWDIEIRKTRQLEEENNRIFIAAYELQNELIPDVPLSEITLTCNPHYRYGGNKTEEELETLLQTDTLKELISYAIGCMMGRYSLDHPGLIYAHSGNVDFDPTKYNTFPADDDGIIPVMDMDWLKDDATNRFVDFLKVAWSPETLQENLTFIADSLGPKRNETPVDTIRRYLSTGFFKDHLKTYKKRPIYWLFSSGKQKAFECLVYLHRYNYSAELNSPVPA